jgi:hypothetical protein
MQYCKRQKEITHLLKFSASRELCLLDFLPEHSGKECHHIEVVLGMPF